nr:chloroplast 50S ribosomal protein L22 [Passiflora contracta]
MVSLPLPVSPNTKSQWNFKNSTSFNSRVSPSFPAFSMASRVVIRPLAYSSSENGLKKEGSMFGNITEVKLFKEQATSRSKAFALSGTANTVTKTKEDAYGEASAAGRFIPMSPDKARRIIDQIRGRKYEEALMILELMPYRGCYPIFKLVYSAAANASHNLGLDKTSLVISKAEVDGGPVKKRVRARARGRANTIRKPTCHIKVVVKDTSLYE